MFLAVRPWCGGGNVRHLTLTAVTLSAITSATARSTATGPGSLYVGRAAAITSQHVRVLSANHPPGELQAREQYHDELSESVSHWISCYRGSNRIVLEEWLAWPAD